MNQGFRLKLYRPGCSIKVGSTLTQHSEREKLCMCIMYSGRFSVGRIENDSFLLIDETEMVLNYK